MTVQFKNDDDLLNPCWDNVFKAMFTADSNNSRKALTGLLGAVLDKKIAKMTIRQNEPATESERERSIRFDINCTFDDGQRANVEMTTYPKTSEVFRIEYFASKLHVSQNAKGKKFRYNDLKESYQISFLCEPLFKGKNFFHYAEYTDQYGEKLNGKIHIIIVELSKLNRVVKKPIAELTILEKWAVFFQFCQDREKRNMINEILKNEEAIGMAGAALQYISTDEDMRARLLTEEKNRLDYWDGINTAMHEGRNQGLAEGKAKKSLEVAKNLKQLGIAVELITKSTGLSAEEIRKL